MGPLCATLGPGINRETQEKWTHDAILTRMTVFIHVQRESTGINQMNRVQSSGSARAKGRRPGPDTRVLSLFEPRFPHLQNGGPGLRDPRRLCRS